MNITIITPTYNERDNISTLIPKIISVCNRIKNHSLNLLVVDDNSPDNTKQVVGEYAQKDSRVRLLLRRKKSGLGAAYIDGIRFALNKLDADAVIQMDADHSHNPEEIPNFISKLESYDFVIGSRYIHGGGIVNWDLKRKAISKIGNLFARFVARLNSINDCTSGYRAVSKTLINKIDLDSINIYGYAFLLGFLHSAVRHGANVIEIPIIFVDRKEGKSKLGKKDIIEFVTSAFRLRNR